MSATFTIDDSLVAELDRLASVVRPPHNTRVAALRDAIALYYFSWKARPKDNILTYTTWSNTEAKLELPFESPPPGPPLVPAAAAAFALPVAGASAATLSDVANQISQPSDVVQRGSYLQRAGKDQFLILAVLAALVLMAFFIYLGLELPHFPSSSQITAADTLAMRLITEQRQAVFTNFIAGIDK